MSYQQQRMEYNMKYSYYVWIGKIYRSIAYDTLAEAVNRVNVLMFQGYNDVRIERV